MEAHFLDSLEIESRVNTPLLEMERQDYINLLQSKDETIAHLTSMIESLKKVLEADASGKLKLLDQLAKFTAEVSKLNDYKVRHNKFTFGKKNLKSSSKPDYKPGREEEERNYDGTSDSLPEATGKSEASAVTVDCVEPSMVSSEPLEKKSGPRGPYITMDAAKVEILESRIDLLPEGMRFIGFKDEDEFGIRHEMYITKDSTDSRRPKINVINGTHCTPEFMSSLAVDRFQLHLPIYRELIRLTGEKIFISEQTVSNWIRKGYELLQNLLPCLKTMLLQSKSVLHIDETWCRVRIKYKGAGSKLGKYYKKYIWVLVNKIEKLVYFLYDNDEDDSRGQRPITDFLGDFKGTIQSDGYVVYKHLARSNPENVHLLCWAHVRAKFKYAAEISCDEDAKWFVEQIGRLYRIEAENILLHRSFDEIKHRRSKGDVTGILSALHARADKMIKNKYLHYGNLMSKALNYMLNGWSELLNYRKDGRYTIDNLEAERAVRPFTVNRKNSLFYSSEEGVDVATRYLTIIETAKMHGLEVRDYLAHVFREIMNGNEDCSTYAPEAFLA